MSIDIGLTPVLVEFISRTNPPPIGRETFFGKQIIIPKGAFDAMMKYHPDVFKKVEAVVPK